MNLIWLDLVETANAGNQLAVLKFLNAIGNHTFPREESEAMALAKRRLCLGAKRIFELNTY